MGLSGSAVLGTLHEVQRTGGTYDSGVRRFAPGRNVTRRGRDSTSSTSGSPSNIMEPAGSINALASPLRGRRPQRHISTWTTTDGCSGPLKQTTFSRRHWLNTAHPVVGQQVPGEGPFTGRPRPRWPMASHVQIRASPWPLGYVNHSWLRLDEVDLAPPGGATTLHGRFRHNHEIGNLVQTVCAVLNQYHPANLRLVGRQCGPPRPHQKAAVLAALMPSAQKVVYSTDDVFQSSVASLSAESTSSPVTENVVSIS
ncbi:hypothetical protein ABIB49_002370 [Arthrobacter sp. UYCu512]